MVLFSRDMRCSFWSQEGNDWREAKVRIDQCEWCHVALNSITGPRFPDKGPAKVETLSEETNR